MTLSMNHYQIQLWSLQLFKFYNLLTLINTSTHIISSIDHLWVSTVYQQWNKIICLLLQKNIR